MAGTDSKLELKDPLSYTKLDEFTSEIFKIEIGGLPRRFGYAQLKKLLNNKLELKCHKFKFTGPNVTWGFITFKCEEDREKALQILNGYKWRGRTLSAKKANPAADPLLRKRKNDDTSDDPQNKREKIDVNEEKSEENLTEMAMNAVMPLWKMEYKDQLNMKNEDIKKLLVKTGKNLEKVCPRVPKWLQENKKSFDFMCCEYEGLQASPVTTGYRNKCEFTVSVEPTGTGKPVVGFRLSKYSKGSICVVQPNQCHIVPQPVLKLAQLFQNYLETTKLAPFNPVDHSGYWRQLTVRYTSLQHMMAIVVINPQTLTQEELETLREDLKTHFNDSESPLTSLYFQCMSKTSVDVQPKLSHISGSKHIVEKLLGLEFRISPDSFFQVNSAATEVLYQTIAQMAQVNPNTVLLDICCGTGTIGISLAKNVKKIIGIEMVESAVDDAKYNAQQNGIDNAEFVCGKVEDTLTGFLYKYRSDDVVAIVDPPRAGLHNKVVRAIRSCKSLSRLIYVACDLSAASTNIVDLCRPESKQYHCHPFEIKKTAAVDLFPYTTHFESIILLQRENIQVEKQTEELGCAERPIKPDPAAISNDQLSINPPTDLQVPTPAITSPN